MPNANDSGNRNTLVEGSQCKGFLKLKSGAGGKKEGSGLQVAWGVGVGGESAQKTMDRHIQGMCVETAENLGQGFGGPKCENRRRRSWERREG